MTGKLKPIALLLLFAIDAHAEDMSYLLNSTPSQRAESQTRFMQTKLALSASELTKIQAINQQYAEKIEPILKGSSFSFIKMQNIKDIQEQKDQDLRNALTTQQFDVYSSSKDELKQALKQDLEQVH